MQGVEVYHREGIEFRIEQQRVTDRYPTWRIAADPMLWWTTVRDEAAFGDATFNSITGGTRTKKDAVEAIEKYLLDKAIDVRLRAQRTA